MTKRYILFDASCALTKDLVSAEQKICRHAMMNAWYVMGPKILMVFDANGVS